MNFLRKLIGAIFLAFILILAACGGDNNGGENASANNGQNDSNAQDNNDGNNGENDEFDNPFALDEDELAQPDDHILAIQAQGEVEDDGNFQRTYIEFDQPVLDHDGVTIHFDYVEHEWYRNPNINEEVYTFYFSTTYDDQEGEPIWVFMKDFYIDGAYLEDTRGFYESPAVFNRSGESDSLYFRVEAEEGERLPLLDGATFEADYTVDRDLVKPYYEDDITFELEMKN